MDSPRCFNCRNRIKPHQPQITHPGTGHVFHDDCWEASPVVEAGPTDLVSSQEDYERRIREDGITGILAPYIVRVLEHPRVPEQRADEADLTDDETGSTDTSDTSDAEDLAAPAVTVPVQQVVAQEAARV